MPYPELKPIEYDHEDAHQMDLYWASWVRGLTGVSTNELLRIKSLWRSGLIALRYSYLEG